MVDPNVRRRFATLVAVAFTDGKLADAERQLLDRKAWSLDLPPGLVREFIDLGRQGKLAVSMPATDRAKVELLDEMIDLVCADGRVEAPEHQLLARVNSMLGAAIPDLRARIRERMDRRAAAPPSPPGPRPAEAAGPSAAQAGRRPPPAPEATPAKARAVPVESPMKNFGVGVTDAGHVEKAGEDRPPLPPGPVLLEGPRMAPPQVADLPPVTLQLFKQAIAFENEEDALHYIERTLTVPQAEAQRLYAAIVSAFPDLKPGTQQLRGARK